MFLQQLLFGTIKQKVTFSEKEAQVSRGKQEKLATKKRLHLLQEINVSVLQGSTAFGFCNWQEGVRGSDSPPWQHPNLEPCLLSEQLQETDKLACAYSLHKRISCFMKIFAYFYYVKRKKENMELGIYFKIFSVGVNLQR